MSPDWRAPVLEERAVTWEDARQLTFDQAFLEYVDLSPDGRTLVVSTDRGGNQDVWTLPADGGEMNRLTVEPMPDWRPMWSPDGNEIAFYSARSGNRDIWVMPADGGPARPLAPHPGTDILPTWSPDGSQIAFSSDRSGTSCLWVVSSSGGEPRQVTDDFAQFAAWSPDGTEIIYSGLGNRLWRVSPGRGEPASLPIESGDVPAWSPDGRQLYFYRSDGGRSDGNIWGLSMEDGREYPVTDLKGRYGALWWAGKAIGAEHVYFIWKEDLGDIWVMDVVTDESE